MFPILSVKSKHEINQSWPYFLIMCSQVTLTEIVPQSFLCGWIPFQGDGIGDNVCNGELSDFERWWQDSTLRRGGRGEKKTGNASYQSSKFYLEVAFLFCHDKLFTIQLKYLFSDHVNFFLQDQSVACDRGTVPAERSLWPQPHLRSGWCSALYRRICWFALWRRGFWRHRQQSPLHRYLLFSILDTGSTTAC